MTPSEVITLINTELPTNGNNEITAVVLRPILIAMVEQINDLVGLESNLPDGTTNVISALSTVTNQKLRNYVEVSESYVVKEQDDVVVFNGSDASLIVLEDPLEAKFKVLTIVNLWDDILDLSMNFVDRFNDDTSKLDPNKALTIISDGDKWQEISNTEQTFS